MANDDPLYKEDKPLKDKSELPPTRGELARELFRLVKEAVLTASHFDYEEYYNQLEAHTPRRNFTRRVPAFIYDHAEDKLPTFEAALYLVVAQAASGLIDSNEDEAFISDVLRMAWAFGHKGIVDFIAPIYMLTPVRLAKLKKARPYNLNDLLQMEEGLNLYLKRHLADVTFDRDKQGHWSTRVLDGLSYKGVQGLIATIWANFIDDRRPFVFKFIDSVYASSETPAVLKKYHQHQGHNWYNRLQKEDRAFGLKCLEAYKKWSGLRDIDIVRHLAQVVNRGYLPRKVPPSYYELVDPRESTAGGAAFYSTLIAGDPETGIVGYIRGAGPIDEGYDEAMYYSAHERTHHMQAAARNDSDVIDAIMATIDCDEDQLKAALAWVIGNMRYSRSIKDFGEFSNGYNKQPHERHAIDAGQLFANYHIAGLYRLELDVDPVTALNRMSMALTEASSHIRATAGDLLTAGDREKIFRGQLYIGYPSHSTLQKIAAADKRFIKMAGVENNVYTLMNTIAAAVEDNVAPGSTTVMAMAADFADVWLKYYDLTLFSDKKTLKAFADHDGKAEMIAGRRTQPFVAYDALPAFTSKLRQESVYATHGKSARPKRQPKKPAAKLEK